MKIGDLVKCHFTGKIGITVGSIGSAVPTYPRWKWEPLQFWVEWFEHSEATLAAAMYLSIVSCK